MVSTVKVRVRGGVVVEQDGGCGQQYREEERVELEECLLGEQQHRGGDQDTCSKVGEEVRTGPGAAAHVTVQVVSALCESRVLNLDISANT